MARQRRQATSLTTLGQAKPTAILVALIVLGPAWWAPVSTWTSRFECWIEDKKKSHGLWDTAGRSRTRSGQRMVAWASADTLEDSFVSEGAVKKEKPNTPYCPVGNQDARAPDREPRRSDVTNCSSVNLSVENESGASVIVLWVNGEGQEVFEDSVEPGVHMNISACRGHYWRARRASAPSGKHRLLSEMFIPLVTAQDHAGTDRKEQSEESNDGGCTGCTPDDGNVGPGDRASPRKGRGTGGGDGDYDRTAREGDTGKSDRFGSNGLDYDRDRIPVGDRGLVASATTAAGIAGVAGAAGAALGAASAATLAGPAIAAVAAVAAAVAAVVAAAGAAATVSASLPSSPAKHESSSPHSASFLHAAASAAAVKDPIDLVVWKVERCVGFRLPYGVGITTALGGMGSFDFSRQSIGGGTQSAEQRAAISLPIDKSETVEVSLERVYQGTCESVENLRRVVCPVCSGTGGMSYTPCDRCGGSGRSNFDTILHDGFEGRSRNSVDGGRNGIPQCRSYCDDHENLKTRSTAGGAAAAGSNAGEGCDLDFRCSSACGGDDPHGRGEKNSNANMETMAGSRVGSDPASTTLKLKRTADCPKCGGAGKVPILPFGGGGSFGRGVCKRCAGARFVEERSSFTFYVPPGAEDGYTEVFKGKGHVDLKDLMSSPEPVEEQCRSDGKTPGGRNGRTGRTHDTSSPSVGSSSKAHLSRRRQVKMGDLRVKVSIPPHPTFWRQKREGFQAEEGDTGMAKIVPTNLHTSVPLSLDEAIKGFTRDITLLDGTVFRFRETLSTLPGTVVRVPNHGMPLHVPGSSSTESGHAFTMTGESCGEENAAATATCESRRAEKHDLLTSEGKLGDLMVEVLVAPPFETRTLGATLFGPYLPGVRGVEVLRGADDVGDLP